MNEYKGDKAKTVHHAIVIRLWEIWPHWAAGHELLKVKMPYAPKDWVGNSGDVRARELARNDVKLITTHPELANRVERADGRDIGLDRRFTYFRYKPKPETSHATYLAFAEKLVRDFDSDRLPVFA